MDERNAWTDGWMERRTRPFTGRPATTLVGENIKTVKCYQANVLNFLHHFHYKNETYYTRRIRRFEFALAM